MTLASQQTFSGGVFHESIEGGRAGAAISCQQQQLRAETADGRTFTIAAPDLELELGGASGKMWLCRDRTAGMTIFSEARGFAAALAALAPSVQLHVTEQQQIERARHRGARILIGTCTAILIVLVTLAPMTLRWMASTTAEHVPVAVDEELGEIGWSSMRQSLKILPDDHPATIAVRSITAQLTAYDNILGDDIDWNYQVFVAEDTMVNALPSPAATSL